MGSIMGYLVFPLFPLLLLLHSCLVVTSIGDFQPSDLNHFPLSGFSLTDTNHVDTPFSVQGLDDLPPLHQGEIGHDSKPSKSPTPTSSPPPSTTPSPATTPRPTSTIFSSESPVYEYYDLYDDGFEDSEYDDNHISSVDDDYEKDDYDHLPLCPGSLRECLTSCSPVNNISQVAYKLCVNECLERCT